MTAASAAAAAESAGSAAAAAAVSFRRHHPVLGDRKPPLNSRTIIGLFHQRREASGGEGMAGRVDCETELRVQSIVLRGSVDC